jgi:integrase
VPDLVWDMVAAMPEGPLCPGARGTRYMQYNTARTRFAAIMDALGIEGYTTHSLRHQFASEAVEDGMNVIDLSVVLAHADPSVTLRTYVHAMPDAEQRTRAQMNARWSSKPAPARPARPGKAARTLRAARTAARMRTAPPASAAPDSQAA